MLAEDEAALRHSVTESLRQAGYVVEAAASFAQAKEKAALYRYDCVLLDLALPDGGGLDLLRALKADNSPAGVLVLTARDGLGLSLSIVQHICAYYNWRVRYDYCPEPPRHTLRVELDQRETNSF